MYAKLFSRITESSLMEEPVNIRYVFIMLLAIADPEGIVVGTDIAIARRLNMPIQEFRMCIHQLGLPDSESNSQKKEGRRVVQSEGERGYEIVNYKTYRGLRDEEERREYMREYMRKRRAGVDSEGVAPVNSRKQSKQRLAKADASPSQAPSQEGESEEWGNIPDALRPLGKKFIEEWEGFRDHRKKTRAPMTPHAEHLILDILKERPAKAIAALQVAQVRAWRGFKWEWYDNHVSGNDSGKTPVPEPSLTPVLRNPSGWREWLKATHPGERIPEHYDHLLPFLRDEFRAQNPISKP